MHDIEPYSPANAKYNATEYDWGNAMDDGEHKAFEAAPIDYNIQADPWLNAPVSPGDVINDTNQKPGIKDSWY